MAALPLDVRDPLLQAAVDERPCPPLPFDPSARTLRKQHLDGVRHLLPAGKPIPEVVEHENPISARDGYQIRTVAYQPRAVADQKTATAGSGDYGRPLIILFHEGGWSMGDVTDEESNARLFARDLGAVCLVPEYRLAPEHPFPIGINDCWDVVQWAAANAGSIGADPTKGFVVGGSSAGANLAAVLCHLSRREGLSPPLTGQWLSVGYVVPPELVPEEYASQYVSMWANKIDPVLPPLLSGPEDKASPALLTQMLKATITSPLHSPLAPEYYPPGGSKDTSSAPLAKAFFQVSGLDPLRDHSIVYQKVLEKDFKVPTRMNLYKGYGHMFWTNWPGLDRSQDYWKDMVAGMKWLLEG